MSVHVGPPQPWAAIEGFEPRPSTLGSFDGSMDFTTYRFTEREFAMVEWGRAAESEIKDLKRSVRHIIMASIDEVFGPPQVDEQNGLFRNDRSCKLLQFFDENYCSQLQFISMSKNEDSTRLVCGIQRLKFYPIEEAGAADIPISDDEDDPINGRVAAYLVLRYSNVENTVEQAEFKHHTWGHSTMKYYNKSNETWVNGYIFGGKRQPEPYVLRSQETKNRVNELIQILGIQGLTPL